jgi:hypothetical protein
VQPSKIENLAGIYEQTLPWAVLATGTFITSCATNNFAVLDLLASPLQVGGRIATMGPQRQGQISVPNWFPVQEAILETSGGEICTKLREISIKQNTTPAQGDNMVLALDLSKVPLRPDTHTFTLAYSPWFRFLSEPANFAMASRCAAYAADCIRFLCVRSGIAASLAPQNDGCDVVTPYMRIEVRGMAQLTSISIVDDSGESTFDLAHRRITIDERMFPAAVAAGRALLATQDRLINVDLTLDGRRMKMAYTGAPAHV